MPLSQSYMETPHSYCSDLLDQSPLPPANPALFQQVPHMSLSLTAPSIFDLGHDLRSSQCAWTVHGHFNFWGHFCRRASLLGTSFHPDRRAKRNRKAASGLSYKEGWCWLLSEKRFATTVIEVLMLRAIEAKVPCDFGGLKSSFGTNEGLELAQAIGSQSKTLDWGLALPVYWKLRWYRKYSIVYHLKGRMRHDYPNVREAANSVKKVSCLSICWML